MKRIVIFGGAGFIGTYLAKHWLANSKVEEVVICDIKRTSLHGQRGVRYEEVDVREPIPTDIVDGAPDWIFNFAAIHREPGHQPEEYSRTNINGAENVCRFAADTGCQNIFFSSSISVYGTTVEATDESTPVCPVSPYGASKLSAELIHEKWFVTNGERRLIVVRPGVVYGPGDPGNIGRMVRAIKKGYFVIPGTRRTHKSYAYIYGLLDSIDFTIASDERFVRYNYVETPTETLGEVAEDIKRFVGSRAPILNVPASVLIPAAHVSQWVLGPNTPIHPARVRKATTPTHIVPKKLIDMGFHSHYSFTDTLHHWARESPQDFS